MKKSQIWVSAVLYIALGVVAITLVLSAGLPLINKIKDRNTVIQTKDLLHTIDKVVRQVASEGPGSRRWLSPVTIKGGKLGIDSENDKIKWEMETEAFIQEPNLVLAEGNLLMYLNETIVEGEYVMHLEMPYKNVADLRLENGFGGALTGKYSILVRNDGVEDKVPVISLVVK